MTSIKQRELDNSSEPQWFVAHTKPRTEKKLASFCHREGFKHELPTVKTVRKYQRKVCTFDNPLFPGYVFLKIPAQLKQKVFQSDYCARILHVHLQDEFENQLQDILTALEYSEDNEIILAPQIICHHPAGSAAVAEALTNPALSRFMQLWR